MSSLNDLIKEIIQQKILQAQQTRREAEEALNRSRYQKAKKLVDSLKGTGELASVKVNTTKTQLENYGGRGLKQHGGHSPVDYSATEVLVDLENELARPFDQIDFQMVVRNTTYLMRLLNW